MTIFGLLFIKLWILLIMVIRIMDTVDTQKMIVIDGEPKIFSSPSIRNLDWDTCLNYCYTTSNCVAVHQNDESSDCQIFDIGKIMEIRTLGPWSGKLMGVKMFFNTTQCSITSDGNSMAGGILTNSTYQNYSISVKDDIWEFTTSPFYNCPDTFWLFFRPLGMWCMGVIFKTDPAGITQVDATQQCDTIYNGILSGFETDKEKLWVAGIGRVKSGSTYSTYGYWVNGIRKSTCMYKNQTGTNCMDSKAFDIVDPTMSSLDAYRWGYDDQPDGMTDNKGTSNCIVFRVQGSLGNGMDDRPCNSVAEPNLVFYNGFVCGFRPNEA